MTTKKTPVTKEVPVKKKTSTKVIAKAPADKGFPELKTLTDEAMYDLIGKFLEKAIPIKGVKLKIVKGLKNRVSAPKPPYVILQVTDENQLSTTETRYTDKHKILWARYEVTISILFLGKGNISASQMGKAFAIRFNDTWASEQFEQYGQPLYPLYCDDIKIERSFTNAEDQYDDACSVDAYFEYHPEFGICENSAKEIVMNVNLTK